MKDETYNVSCIECPYCHYEHTDDLPYRNEGETIEWECHNCVKTFFVSISCAYSFTGKKHE